MSRREALGWLIPAEIWDLHERRIREKWGETNLYAGFEASRIMKLWMAVEECDLIDGSPSEGETRVRQHIEEKNETDTPLSEQEKRMVGVRVHPATKERFARYAPKYDVNKGVLLAYALREYYETNGWGYGSIEAVDQEQADTKQKQETTDEIPSSRRERKALICDRLDPDPEKNLHVEQLREEIATVAGETVIDAYLPDVLDRLDYVHHPDVAELYVHESRFANFDVDLDDPAIDRKPYAVLDREEKVDGIKIAIHRNGGMTVPEIHERVFDGNGSRSHVRDLVSIVAEADGYRYRSTVSGNHKILQAIAPDPSLPLDHGAESEDEQEQADDNQERRNEVEQEAGERMDQLMAGEPA